MLKIIIFIALLVWVAWSLASLEQRSLYYPDRTVAATPAIHRLPFEDVFLKTSDGIQVNGWFIPGDLKDKTGPTLLFFHGNAGNISHRLDKLLEFHKLGLNVLLLDYRGYGKSEGKPSEQGTYRDGEAAWRFLTAEKKIPPGKIVLYGESLGSAVAVEMARRYPAVRGLILESPFTSIVAMGKLVYPWLPVQWMVRYRYDTLAKIPNIHSPLLILHSPQDEIVPFSMAQQLYAAAPGPPDVRRGSPTGGPKKFFELSGGHNDGYAVTGKSYIAAIASFLKEIR